MSEEDPYLWLEDVTGERALEWVRARTGETERAFTEDPEFDRLRDGLLGVLDADGRIPYVRRRGRFLYNFWRDTRNPRGVWRRTTLEEYRRAAPAWETVLDVDALAEDEGENWVWAGASVLRPDFRSALVGLSREGADATVCREFDIEERRFVKHGFTLPEAKSDIGWIDPDRIYVGTDFGEGSLTTSGYPRLVKEWKRGTPLEEAELVFEGEPGDVAVGAFHDASPGFERDFVYRMLDFHRSHFYLRTPQGELRLVDVPEDSGTSVHREWLLVRTRTPWETGGREYPAGALLAIGFERFLGGGRDFTVVFEPDAHTSLTGCTWTRDHLLLTVLVDVRSELRVATPAGGDGSGRGDGGGGRGWSVVPLGGVPEMGTATVVGTDPDEDNEYLTVTGGFTTPPTLSRHTVGGGEEVLKQAPSFFESEGMSVSQHFAASADGTRVPYFVVRPPGGGCGRTLLSGYGGFEVSRTPAYDGLTGRGWLERGGTYVLANIRGGGEYGPGWHTQTVQAGRHKVYEDFAAIAADLAARDIASPQNLAIRGGSNGGLLMGVMLTHYPKLFAAIAGEVPLLDMRRYHKLLAGASWMAEYGDPDDPEQWAYIGEYSPYHRVRAEEDYPPVLFTTSSRDDRVHPAHARKMTARLRELGHTVHFYENTEGGHTGAKNEQTAFERALVFTFLWNHCADRG